MGINLRELAHRLKRVERQVETISQPRIGYASFEAGEGIEQYDGETPVQRVGTQWDGTHVAAVLSGPVPPRPSAPTVTAASGGLIVSWGGTFAEGLTTVAPMDFAGVDIVVSTAATPDFIATPPVNRFVSPRGGAVLVALPASAHKVALVARSLAGKASDPSGWVAATPLAEANPAFTGNVIPTSTKIGDLWVRDSDSQLFHARIAGANEIKPGEWEAVTGELPIPTTTPSASPGTSVTPTYTSFIVVAGDISQTTVLDYYVDGVIHPGYTGTRKTTVQMDTTPAGAAFAPGVEYAFHVVARNVVGSATAGPTITSALLLPGEPVTAELVLAKLNAAIAEFGTIRVGDLTIDANDGITIPQSTGRTTSFPADGSPSVFGGDAEVDSLNVLGNLTIRGTTNELAKGSTFELTAGVSAPKVEPAISGVVPTAATHEGYQGKGLAWHSGRGVWYMTESVGIGVITTLGADFSYGFDSFDLVADGGRSEVTSGMGGIAMIGDSAYVLCQTNEAAPGTYYGRWYVYQYRWDGSSAETGSMWTFVRRWLYEPHPGGLNNLGGYSTQTPTIAADGTNIYIAQSAKQGAIHVTRYSSTGTSETIFLTQNSDGSNWNAGGASIHGFEVSAADVGAVRWWITLEGNTTVHAIDPVTLRRVPAHEWTATTSAVRGLAYHPTEGRFITKHDGTISRFSKITVATAASVRNTWRKADETGPEYASAETSGSPTAATTVAARRWLRMETGISIPNDGGTPDATTFYVNGFRASTPAVGVQTDTLDTIPTSGGAIPGATYGFAGGTSKIHSDDSLGDADGPIIRLEGTGSGRTGPLRWDAAGARISVGDTWHLVGAAGEPAFQNGWQNPNPDLPLRFIKDPLGYVTLTGLISGGTARSIFYLPVGYAPQDRVIGLTAYRSGSALARIDIAPEGTSREVGYITADRSGNTSIHIVYPTF